MPDDMNAEAIETLAVQLVGDASPLLDSVDAAVEQAKEKLGEIGEAGPGMEAGLAEIVKGIEAVFAAQGKVVSPETLAGLQAIVEKYSSIAANTADAAEKMRLYVAMEKEALAYAAQAEATGGITAGPPSPLQALAGGLFAQVSAGRQAQGRGWGIMEADAFRKKLEGLYIAAERLGAPFEQVTREAQAMAQAEIGAARGGGALEQALGGVFQKGFSAGGIIKMLGTRILGVLGPAVLLFKAIQGIVRMFKEAQQAAMAYDTSLYHLEVSVRAAQRVMGEQAGTIEQWMQAAEGIAAKYGVQTVAAVNEIAASVRRMTLQFDLSADKAIALTDAGVALATQFGDSPGSLTEIMARFVSTGQNTEGLAQYGYDLTNVALQAETTREGLAGLYSDLREDQQIQIRYNLVMQQSAQMMEDAGVATTTTQGRQAAYAAAIQTYLARIGQAISPLTTLWRGFVQIVKELSLILVERVLKGLLASFITFTSMMVGAARVVLDELRMIKREGRLLTEEEVFASYGAGFQTMVEGMSEVIRNLTSGIAGLGDEEDAAAAAAAEMAEKTAASFLILRAKFAELAARIKNILREIDDAYAADVLEVNEDMLRERQKKTEDYARDEERDLQDHLLKMRRMEEDYLLELEDAVRERDARQVLLLMRRHRIDVRRANEDANIRRRDRREAFQQELQDMAEQANRRLAELDREHRARREQALAEHKAYSLQLIEQWLQLEGITAEGIQTLHDMLLAAFGPGEVVSLFDQASGLIRKIVNETTTGLKIMVDGMAKSVRAAATVVQQTLAWMASERVGMGQQTTWRGMGSAIGAGIAGFWGGGGTGAGGNPYTAGYQTGGDFVATGPRTIKVGEGRPEAVSIRPFSGSGAAAGGQGGGGRAKMEIDLNVKADPRLIVEATEAAMSEVADVFINITRVSREGRG